jgi:hypothetical protein
MELEPFVVESEGEKYEITGKVYDIQEPEIYEDEDDHW